MSMFEAILLTIATASTARSSTQSGRVAGSASWSRHAAANDRRAVAGVIAAPTCRIVAVSP